MGKIFKDHYPQCFSEYKMSPPASRSSNEMEVVVGKIMPPWFLIRVGCESFTLQIKH